MSKTLEQFQDLVLDIASTYVQGADLGRLTDNPDFQAVTKFAWSQELGASKVAHWMVEQQES